MARRRLAIENNESYRAKVGPEAEQSQNVRARQGAGDFEASAQLGSAQQSQFAGGSALQSGGLQQSQQAQQQAQQFSSQQSEASRLQQQADQAASQFQQTAQRVSQPGQLS